MPDYSVVRQMEKIMSTGLYRELYYAHRNFRMNDNLYKQNFNFKGFIAGMILIAVLLGLSVYGLISLLKDLSL